MFRISSILLVAAGLFTASFSTYQEQEDYTPEEIEITYVDVAIHTKDNVDCDSFEKVFAKKKPKKKKIDSQGERTRFMREIFSLEQREDKFPMNTRAQIIITGDRGTETICADHLSVYRDGKCYVITQKIKSAIWKH